VGMGTVFTGTVGGGVQFLSLCRPLDLIDQFIADLPVSAPVKDFVTKPSGSDHPVHRHYNTAETRGKLLTQRSPISAMAHHVPVASGQLPPA